MKRLRAVSCLFVLCAAAAWASPRGGAAASSASAQEAIDVNDCRSCHEAPVAALERTRHLGVPQSCEACHDGVREHLKSVLDTGEPGAIVRMLGVKHAARTERCLGCHDKGAQAGFSGGVHDRRMVGCTSCHSIHAFKSLRTQLKSEREPETCYSCHQAVRGRMQRVSHHPVREGAMRCSSCHDVHGSNPKLVAADWVNETCYSCHEEKRGPFLWEHGSARDNCLNCHDPHGSNHRGMLITKPPYLCQRCHLNSLHAAVLYDGRDTPRGAGQGLGATTVTAAPTAGRGRACLNCHRSIHGSNSPSSAILVR
jgi:DmsE family decaheme c-type cytochrome